jgi:hypothetical protein
VVNRYIDPCLGTYNVESDNENNFSNSNFVNRGGRVVFFNKLKMASAQNLKALIIF